MGESTKATGEVEEGGERQERDDGRETRVPSEIGPRRFLQCTQSAERAEDHGHATQEEGRGRLNLKRAQGATAMPHQCQRVSRGSSVRTSIEFRIGDDICVA